MTFRFLVAMIICLLLVVANSVVLIEDYERRLAAYHTAVKTHHDEVVGSKTYSFLFSRTSSVYWRFYSLTTQLLANAKGAPYA